MTSALAVLPEDELEGKDNQSTAMDGPWRRFLDAAFGGVQISAIEGGKGKSDKLMAYDHTTFPSTWISPFRPGLEPPVTHGCGQS